MTTKKPAPQPVPIASAEQVDAWYRQGLLDPAQHADLAAQLEADDDTPAAA